MQVTINNRSSDRSSDRHRDERRGDVRDVAEREGRTICRYVPDHARPLLAVTSALSDIVTMQDVMPTLLGTLMLATFAVRSIDSSAFGKLTRICLVIASLAVVF